MWKGKCLTLCMMMAKTSFALEVYPNSLKGTQTIENELSDKQLAIQRWFASITYLQDRDDWKGYGGVINDVNCDGNTCLRYELSGLAYAIALLSYKTPAYSQVNELILFNVIERMLTKPVYQYIEVFDDFVSQSTYPDPVAYKNIMYSGHLAQMISLFEFITGNFTFNEDGFEFDWGENSSFPQPIPYNTTLLFHNIYEQSKIYEIGGIPCEPDSIFVICNNYPYNAFKLFDLLYNDTIFEEMNVVWKDTIVNKALNKMPPVEGMDKTFFNLDYIIQPVGFWEPIATIGSDVWALSWMKTWFSSGNSDDVANTILESAFQSIYNSSGWVTLVEERGHETDDLLPMSYLHPSSGTRIFPFDDFITSSFYPMIEKQYLGTPLVDVMGDVAECTSRIPDVYRYMEAELGHFFDSDGDAVRDSYQYNTNTSCTQGQSSPYCESGDYSVWITANMLVGMILPAANLNFLRDVFGASEPFYKQNERLPKVAQVQYPEVMVAKAVFHDLAYIFDQGRSSTEVSQRNNHPYEHSVHLETSIHNNSSLLEFKLRPGDNCPSGNHLVILANIISLDNTPLNVDISLNGVQFSDYEIDIDSNQIQLSCPGWATSDQEALAFLVYFSS